MGQVLTFAIQSDWLPVFEEVRRTGDIRCAPVGFLMSDEVPEFSLDVSLPNLGRATDENYVFSQSYLVYDGPVDIQTVAVTPEGEGEMFDVSQLHNGDTVWLAPGGILRNGVLIGGCVGTVSDAEASLDLMRRFRSAIRRHFRRKGAFLVGPGATTLLKAGWRLSTNATAPAEFDLRAEE
jgi:hypothetical protein